MNSGGRIILAAAFIFFIAAVIAQAQSFSLLSATPTNSITQTYNSTNTAWDITDTNALVKYLSSPYSVSADQIESYSNYSNPIRPVISGTNVVPLIELVDVPLVDALRNLAWRGQMNCMIDPWIDYRGNGTELYVTFKREKMTASDALFELCKIYGLKIHEDLASGIMFIQNPKYRTRFLNAALFDHDTNVMPVVRFDHTPFTQALKQMAKKAKIDYILDARIRFDAPDEYGRLPKEPRLTLDWHNLTATQVFIAICEDFDLNVIKYPESGVYRVEIRD